MKVEHLRVNHQKRPVIDDIPEFSYRITSDNSDVTVKAYRITVESEGNIYWDSGIVESDRQSFISYEGKPLKSRQTYRYEITVWDNHGETGKSSDEFETGLYENDWMAKWSESPFERNEHHMLSDGIINPVISFVKNFSIDRKIRKARLYATCYGVYRPLLNGKRIDDREFAPEFTPYSQVLYYQTYDVKDLLKQGSNHLEMLVGDGWYFDSQTVPVNADHKYPAVLFQLELEYEDGACETVASEGTETYRETNIVYSDLYVGEKTNLTQPYSPEKQAVEKDYGYDVLCAQKMDPVRAVETFKPVNIFHSPKGELIVDFGQVIAGRCRIHLNEERDREVILHHTEVLDKEGNYFAALTSRQRDTVICDGTDFVYEPMFTFHGFRYVWIEGLEDIQAEDICAVLLSTEKENRGDFRCSDERLNCLYKNIRYSQKNNMMSIPTDCPQREKAGWTGDVLVYGRTSLLNEEMTPFYNSWLNGLRNDQYDNGAVPIISPYTKMYEFTVNKTMKDFETGRPTGILEDMLPKAGETSTAFYKSGVAGWSDVMIWLPYAMYQINGDIKILEECYDAMKKWTDNIIFTAANKRNEKIENPEVDMYLWNTGFHFGEWLVPGHIQEGFEITKETSWYIAPMFGYESVRLMSEIASILGRNEKEYYSSYAENMKKAIQEEVLSVHDEYDCYMGRYVLALQFDLVSEEMKKEYCDKLVALVEENNGCLGTGFLGTPFILDVLDKIGRSDLSKTMLFSEKKPSWLYEVKMGATTIWESWDAINEDGSPNRISFDHYAFGVVDDYIFRKICGITQDKPGFKSFTINPRKDLGIDKVYRRYESEYGDIIVDIDYDTLKLTVPCNTSARVLWNGHEYEVGSGVYQWN